MTLEELPAWARELIEEARVARLALLDEEEHPRALPVTFCVWEGALWSAIDHKPKRSAEPARVRRLRAHPHATLLVDRYDDDWSRLAWVELRGPVSVLEADAAPGALDALAAKYPPYRERRPDGPLLRLAPERLVLWRAAESP